jgi:ComF family protein
MLLRALENAVMPLRCVFCGTRSRDEERFICAGCHGDLPWSAAPLAPAPAGLEAEVAPLCYAFPVDAALKAFKFRRRLFYAPAFADLLVGACGLLPPDIDAVLPVPLHWRRQWWRGFNQAYEIGKPVARHLGRPLVNNVVRRRATPTQSGLDAAQRARNLNGAFLVRSGPRPAHVLIVDDVITTGTTVRRLATVLQGAGVDRVSALAVARA